jgi:outer membrane receptor protein involved in Fe transport
MKTLYTLGLIICLLMSGLTVYSQETNKYDSMTREEIMQMSLEDLLALPFEDLLSLANKLGVSIDDLLKMKTTVASKTAINPRETPGIISIITDEEIENSGARDLIDVIKLIPGVNIQFDDAGVFGIQMRGNWGFEGKVLVLIDGQEFNDLKYNVVPFGHHFNVHQIKRIEIIRGPGSSIYGGNAELGVINIITKDGGDINGISASADFGFNPNVFKLTNWNIRTYNYGISFYNNRPDIGVSNLNLNAGKKIGQWNISATGSLNRGYWTDQNFIDYDGSTYTPADTSALVNMFNLNLAVSNDKLSMRFITDNFNTQYLTDSISLINKFKTRLGEIKYDYKPSDNLTITPKFNFKNSIPYYDEGWYLNNSISRYTGNVTTNWDATKSINIVGGIEYYYDYAKMLEKTDSSLFYVHDTVNGESTVSLNNIAVYFQSIVKTRFVNLILGGRYDHHSQYSGAFAPRIGITKIWNDFHAKLLYSRAFHSPSFGNIEFEPGIKPEYTMVTELEAGYKINNNMYITANFFNINIKNPIIWYINEYEEYGYKNDKKTGTVGFEVEYKMKYNWGYGYINYSFYKPNAGNTVGIYEVPDHENAYLGAPNHKITLNTSFKLNNTFNINPSAVYYSKTYGYLGEFDEFKEYSPSVVLNVFLTAELKCFELGAGVYDLFNNKPKYVQPYQGWNFPYPAPSRQFLLRATYNFKFE